MNLRVTARAILIAGLAAALFACGRNDPAKFVASAEKYLAQGNYPAAVIELKNALSASPDDARARYLLGSALLAAGDPVAAETELRKALALGHPTDRVYPELAQAWVQRGAPRKELTEFEALSLQDPKAKAALANALAVAYLSYGQNKEARAQVDAALALDPSSLPVRRTQARLMAADNDLPGAMANVTKLLADAPDDVESLMLKAEIELRAGKRAESASTLERLLTARPDHFRARYMLVTIYVQAKEIDKAVRENDALVKQAPKDPRTHHATALVAFVRDDIPGALDAVQKSLQAAPDFLPALYLSGLVDMRRGAYEASEQSLRKVLANSPDEVGARVALAQTLLSRGQAARARETLEPLLLKQPDDVSTLRLAAEIELAQRRPDKASEYIERANALEDDNVRGRVRLAQVRLAKGETVEGIRELEKLSAEQDKRDPDAALIAAHMRARDFDKALAAADALIKKQPQSAFAHNAKGAVYAAKGDVVNARTSFDKALSLDPNYVPAIVNLASLDGAERKFDDARKRYSQILAKDPKSERALMGLVQIDVAANAPPATVIASLQRAIAANPQSVPPRIALIAFHGKQKDFAAAIAAGQAALTAIPEQPAILDALAAAQLANGEKNQAIETYARLVKLQPENPLPMMRIAGIHASLKNYDASITSLRNALSVAPNNVAIWIALAAVYRESGKMQSGYAEAKRLQGSVTSRAAGYGLEAELLAAEQKQAEAVATYRTALSRGGVPGSVNRLYALLVATGKPDEASAVAQKWIAEHPKDVAVRTFVGQQSITRGDFKGAANYLRAALDVEPNNLTLLNDLAWALAQTKDPKAIGYAERAYRMAPTNPNVVNTYGWALVQGGDTAQGLQMLRRAVDLDPADANRRLYLARGLIQIGDKGAARKELEIVANSEVTSVRTQAAQLLKEL